MASADDGVVLNALTAIRDLGLVVDRDQLNRGWAELTGRTPATSGTRCSRRDCTEVGIPFTEPAGTWCMSHLPVLWRMPDNPWVTPSCHACGRPGAWPNRNTINREPACRSHAPKWMRRYLADETGDPR